MKAHIISIGDELLIGQTVNSNASKIGKLLTEISISITGNSVIPDDPDTIKKYFESTLSENDIVLVTGGLGPTHDDVTRSCVVDFFNSSLVQNETVLAHIQTIFKNRGRELTPSNIDQSFVPEIAEVIFNSKGTAPGMWIEKDGKILVVMPGVPYEMIEMMNETVIPRLKEITNFTGDNQVIKNLLTTGIPESFLYERLGDMNELLEGSKMAFLPNQFGVKMRITVKGESQEQITDKLSGIEQRIRARVGRFIYGIEEQSIEEVVARLLIDRGISIAVAESCTGGQVASRLTNIPGSSAYFERGIISYSNGAKVELLKVDEDFIEDYGAVSMEVVRQMAEGVRAVSGTDIGLAITGILGPTGNTPTKPIGLVYIGICDETVVTAREYRFGEDRWLNKDRASQAALEMLRRNLLGIPYED